MPVATPLQTRSFSDPAGYGARLLTYDQFDPALGIFAGMRLGVSATVSGRLSVESLEARGSSAAYAPSALVGVFAPDGAVLAYQGASAAGTAALGAFDGVVDFAGASGISVAATGSGSSTTGFTTGGTIDGSAFIGTGTVELAVSDYANNRIDGPANMRVLAEASVGGTVTLAYDYTPRVEGGGGSGGVISRNYTVYTYNDGTLPPRPVTVTTAAQVFRFADQTTGWRDSFAVAQFDAGLGTLSAVQVRLVGDLAASAAVENHGAAAGNIEVNQSATTSLALADGSVLAAATNSAWRRIAVGAGDGSDDFAGPGGGRDGGLKSVATVARTLGDQAVSAAFTGTGSVDVSIDVLGVGSVSGPASFLADLAAQSGAVVEIAYTYFVDAAAAAVVVADGKAGTNTVVGAQRYAGPVATLQHEFIDITPDNLTVAATTDNWFIRTGDGTDAIAARGGVNVLDGGGGSNFLTGGFGADTFFLDARAATADIWSTLVGFQSGDAATVWGITQADFALAWSDNEGAAGASGLTLHATAAGHPTASLTLQGFSTAALTNGVLSVSFGGSGDNAYLYIKAN